MAKDGELYIVTEQGVFGGLDIDDPSKKKPKTQQEMDQLIAEANQRNLGNDRKDT